MPAAIEAPSPEVGALSPPNSPEVAPAARDLYITRIAAETKPNSITDRSRKGVTRSR